MTLAAAHDNPLVVCILGKSRSGTSITARIVNLLGVTLGPDDELMPPAAGNNPKGFWEHKGIADLNERILAALSDPPPQIRQAWRWPPPLRAGWELDERLVPLRQEARDLLRESFGDAPAWGWKDPRTCLTLPFWKQLVPEPHYVICVRHPLDVAASLEARDAMPRDEALALWLLYTSHAVLRTRGGRRLVVSHESYFPAWVAQAERLARFLDLPAIPAAQRSAIADHLEEGLWHHRDGARLDVSLGEEIAVLYAHLVAHGESDAEAGPEAQAALDRAARRGVAAAARALGQERRLSG